MVMPTLFANWHKLSTRIVGLLLSFLAVALLVIGSTLLLSWQLEGSAAAINVAGSLRMDSYRMAMLAGQVSLALPPTFMRCRPSVQHGMTLPRGNSMAWLRL